MARFTVCDIAASTPKSSNTERANPNVRFAILFMLLVLSRQEIEWNGLGLSQWIFSVKRLVRLSAFHCSGFPSVLSRLEYVTWEWRSIGKVPAANLRCPK